ncbi:MAG: triose-phosphate isomerase [Candidatus Woesearchaeota archaeon]
MIIINLKTYDTASGDNAIELARASKEYSAEFKIPIIIAPSHYDIKECSKHCMTYAQHIDGLEADRNTGYLPLQLAIRSGAKGSLLNHSEHRMNHNEIARVIEMAKKKRFKIVLCAKDHKEAALLSKYNPYAIAVEPPELIAGNISVSTAKPDIIRKSVMAVKDNNPRIKLLVGAGIKNAEDVKKSLSLGAKGILIASGIVLAKDSKKALLEMIRGFV